MRPLLLVAMSIVLVAYDSYGKDGKRSALRLKHPIVVDGANDEWPSPYPFSDANAKIQYAVANDSATLYISVKSSDDVIKGKFARSGLTLFIDTKNGKGESLFFDFLVDPVKKAPSTAQADNGSSDTLEQAKDFFQKRKEHEPPASTNRPPTIALNAISIGGTENYDGKYSIKQCPGGIAVAAAINDVAELVWEIAIPFSIFTRDSDALFRKDISIGLVEYPLAADDFEDIMKASLAVPARRIDNATAKNTQSEARSGEGMKTGRKGGDPPEAGGAENNGGGDTQRNSRMDDIEDMSELMRSPEPPGDKWIRANAKNETWRSVRLSGGK